MKSLSVVALITIIISAFMLAGTTFSLAQTGTNVSGIISSDTTWTKANSPHVLTGPTAIAQGVTLTIEPGVTVDLNSYYIQVNGTLAVKGNVADKVRLNGGQIIFTSVSNGWSEQTGLGCIIENAELSSTSISSVISLKVNRSSIDAKVSVGGSSIILNSIFENEIMGSAALISNNTIVGSEITSYYITIPTTRRSALNISSSAVISNNSITGDVTSSTSTISNNIITGNVIGSTISNNIIMGNVNGGSKIMDNTIRGDITTISSTISNNTIIGGMTNRDFTGRPIGGAIAIHVSGSSQVSNNIINDAINEPTNIGIFAENDAYIYDNAICGFESGIVGSINSGKIIIERNLIINNTKGITINKATTIIQNNTISNNSIGIIDQWNPSSPTIAYNNIQNNQNIYLTGASNNINATYNWWGTTDIAIINQTIHDSKNDFNIGTVDFIPFLTEPNLQATPSYTPITSTSLPVPSTTPTSSPEHSSTTLPSQHPTLSTSPSHSQNLATSPNQINTQTSQIEFEAVITGVAIVSLIVIFVIHRRSKNKSAR